MLLLQSGAPLPALPEGLPKGPVEVWLGRAARSRLLDIGHRIDPLVVCFGVLKPLCSTLQLADSTAALGNRSSLRFNRIRWFCFGCSIFHTGQRSYLSEHQLIAQQSLDKCYYYELEADLSKSSVCVCVCVCACVCVCVGGGGVLATDEGVTFLFQTCFCFPLFPFPRAAAAFARLAPAISALTFFPNTVVQLLRLLATDGTFSDSLTG